MPCFQFNNKKSCSRTDEDAFSNGDAGDVFISNLVKPVEYLVSGLKTDTIE